MALLLDRTKCQIIQHYWMLNNKPSERHPKRPVGPGRLPAFDFIMIVSRTPCSLIRPNKCLLCFYLIR